GMPFRRPVAAYGAFWSTVEQGGAGRAVVVRVDARTLRTSILALPGESEAVAAGFGSIWVATCSSSTSKTTGLCGDGSVFRIQPSSGEVIASVQVTGYLYPIAVGEGAVWVASRSPTGERSTIVRIDPSTLRVTEVAPVDFRSVSDIAAGEGFVWMAVNDRLQR